jgi:hypothetical protein
VIHVEGATRPNSPRLPNYTKANVYFPRHLINEDPQYSPILSRMVQDYFVNIGLPVVGRWERCARGMWPLTQGRNAPVPQAYPAQSVPASIPNGSSTFVYHGHSVNTNPTPTPSRIIVDDYDDDSEELDQAVLESLAIVERCALLEADLFTIRAKLTATEDALNKALSCVANLQEQLDAGQATRAHVSALADGLGSGSPVCRQLSRHPSPLPQTPTTPSRPGSYRIATTTPRVFHQAQQLSQLDGPISSQNGSPFAAPHVDALRNYYSYLTDHDLSGFIPALDTLRNSFPISSWSEQMKLFDFPLDEKDSVMSLMANIC